MPKNYLKVPYQDLCPLYLFDVEFDTIEEVPHFQQMLPSYSGSGSGYFREFHFYKGKELVKAVVYKENRKWYAEYYEKGIKTLIKAYYMKDCNKIRHVVIMEMGIRQKIIYYKKNGFVERVEFYDEEGELISQE